MHLLVAGTEEDAARGVPHNSLRNGQRLRSGGTWLADHHLGVQDL
jgi:hypothetical protein